MKKLIIIAALFTSALTINASRGGRGRDLVLKNSMAGFASESIEESVRLLYRTSPATKDLVIVASVELISQEDSVVSIELNNGTSATFNCIRFDDWSNSGTVLKKEVVCRR